MSHIAITGGIGSGKSYVCRLLEQHGIAVYDCDRAAKRLLAQDGDLQRTLTRLVGPTLYKDGRLQKDMLAKFLLQSEANKLAIDEAVHPAVARDYMQSGLTWLESAILFDSGFDHRVHFDHTVCVTAPLELRVQRVMTRDGISRDKAMEWICRQWPQQKVAERCDFVIVNDGTHDLNTQINNLLKTIL